MRLTKEEKTSLLHRIDEILSHETEGSKVPISDLAKKSGYSNNQSGLTRLLRGCYVVTGRGPNAAVTVCRKSNPVAINGFIKKLLSTIEHQTAELDACYVEIKRLQRSVTIPVVSDQVRRAIAQYGD
jgi:hypothetical protein